MVDVDAHGRLQGAELCREALQVPVLGSARDLRHRYVIGVDINDGQYVLRAEAPELLCVDGLSNRIIERSCVGRASHRPLALPEVGRGPNRQPEVTSPGGLVA